MSSSIILMTGLFGAARLELAFGELPIAIAISVSILISKGQMLCVSLQRLCCLYVFSRKTGRVRPKVDKKKTFNLLLGKFYRRQKCREKRKVLQPMTAPGTPSRALHPTHLLDRETENRCCHVHTMPCACVLEDALARYRVRSNRLRDAPDPREADTRLLDSMVLRVLGVWLRHESRPL